MIEFYVKRCPKCKTLRQSRLLFADATHKDYVCYNCNTEFCSLGLREMYVVIRDPNSVNENAPARTYETLEQAIHVLENLCKKNPGAVYYIAQLIKKGTTSSVTIEDV